MDTEETIVEKTLDQKAIGFATSDHYAGAVEILRQVRTQLHSVLGENEFQTMVNALTLELEANLIQRFVVEINNIREGKSQIFQKNVNPK